MCIAISGLLADPHSSSPITGMLLSLTGIVSISTDCCPYSIAKLPEDNTCICAIRKRSFRLSENKVFRFMYNAGLQILRENVFVVVVFYIFI